MAGCSPTKLADGGPAFERVIERLRRGGGGQVTERAIGSQLVRLYLRFVWPAVAAFALERRVPDVAASNLLVRFDGAGWPSEFALREPRFAAQEHDAAAAEASIVVRDEAELLVAARPLDRRECRATHRDDPQPAAHERDCPVGQRCRCLAHPLLWHVQHVAPESGAIVRDAEALLRRREAPSLGDQVRLLRVVQGDREWTVHARRTCCLRWCLPGDSRCADCPLLREPQAGEFLRSRLAEAIARGELRRAKAGLAQSRGTERETA